MMDIIGGGGAARTSPYPPSPPLATKKVTKSGRIKKGLETPISGSPQLVRVLGGNEAPDT